MKPDSVLGENGVQPTASKATCAPAASAYSPEFFESVGVGSLHSAKIVAKLIALYTDVSSVIDFGCGTGAWLAAFKELGVRDVLGIDSATIPEHLLEIEPAEFLRLDLTQEVRIGRRFDLVVCLETGEHLPDAAAAVLVKSLEQHGDLVAFSAAVPGQGGTEHINERPLGYWLDHFIAHDFRAFDLIRPAIWNDTRVDWWYRQNLVLLARGSAADRLPSTQRPIEAIHPALFDYQRNQLEQVTTQLQQAQATHLQLQRDLATASQQIAHMLETFEACRLSGKRARPRPLARLRGLLGAWRC